MATVTTVPELVLPDKPMQFAFTATAGGNFVKVWCTSAPRGSNLRQQLDAAQSARVVVIAESDISKRPQYTFDKGGAYVLEIEEIQKGAEAYGGRYRGDPDSYRTEDVTDNSPATVSVASRLEAELGVSPDTATLQLYVSAADIIATTPATHGFASPAIVRPNSDRARAAADASAVLTALEALGDTTALGSLGTLRIQIDDFIQQFNSHIADSSQHANADTDNEITTGFTGPRTLKATVKTLAECAKRFLYHIQNIDPTATDPFPGSASYHEDGGDPISDWENMLLAAGGSTIGACQILFADLARCFTQHIVDTDVHTVAGEWFLNSQPALTDLHMEFLAELAALAPTPPANEHLAKVLLVSGGGFKES